MASGRLVERVSRFHGILKNLKVKCPWILTLMLFLSSVLGIIGLGMFSTVARVRLHRDIDASASLRHSVITNNNSISTVYSDIVSDDKNHSSIAEDAINFFQRNWAFGESNKSENFENITTTQRFVSIEKCEDLDGKARICRSKTGTFELYNSFSGRKCYTYSDKNIITKLYDLYKRCILNATSPLVASYRCPFAWIEYKHGKVFDINNKKNDNRRFEYYSVWTPYNHTFNFERDAIQMEITDLFMNVNSQCYFNMSQTNNFFRFITENVK